MRQLQAIHCARHLNVCKKQRDIGSRFKNGYGLIGINGLYRMKTGILDNVDRAHAQDHLVLDDENV